MSSTIAISALFYGGQAQNLAGLTTPIHLTAICPNCGESLSREFNHTGTFWACASCGGRAIGLGALRKVVREDYLNHLWALARDGEGRLGRSCPLCRYSMFEVTVPEGERSLNLDVCRRCLFVWFDPDEFDWVPPRPVSPPQNRTAHLPQKARELIAIEENRILAEQNHDPGPDATWKTVPAIFGLPVMSNDITLKSVPRMTYGLAAMITAVSIAAFFNLSDAINEFGFIPSEAVRTCGATFITSFFIHGGVMHLVGNVYFLIIFGRVVEDVIGTWEWLTLVMLSALTGDLLHLATNWNSTVPCIGASGGISGLITFYALRFPKARLSFFFRYGLLLGHPWIQLPVWGAFTIWLIVQGVEALIQSASQSGVAHFAHLGGALAGLIFWLRWKREEFQRRQLQVDPPESA